MESSRINISALKEWALRSLSSSSTLRAIILQEEDTLETMEFLGRMGIWLRLARLEDGSGNTRR